MWTAAKITELVTELDKSHAGENEYWFLREYWAPMQEQFDSFHVALPQNAKLLGSWPRADGKSPPLSLVEQLNTSLENMQNAHARDTGGPNESAGVAVGIRGSSLCLAVYY